MYIKSINLKEVLKSKRTKVIVGILSILFILIIAVFTLSKVSRISNGISIKNILEYIGGKKENIFNMTSYKAEYTMVVVSNKNTNSYDMKEIYDSGKTRYEYLDSVYSKVFLIVNKDKVKIQNESQKNIFIQDFENIGLTNMISISTFLEIYRENKDKKDENIIIEEYLKNGYLKIIMNIEDEEKKDISKMELEIDDKTKLPSTYIVYNENKKEMISIIYNKFNINPKIDSKIFDIY